MNLCTNNATCDTSDFPPKCNCLPQFTGPTCADDFPECDSSPCENKGECPEGVDGYTCTCITVSETAGKFLLSKLQSAGLHGHLLRDTDRYLRPAELECSNAARHNALAAGGVGRSSIHLPWYSSSYFLHTARLSGTF